LPSRAGFGPDTAALSGTSRSFPEQFDRARSETAGPGIFRGFAPVNQNWNYGVARRFQTVPWTVFYMIPEDSLLSQIGAMQQKKAVFAGVIILLALAAGTRGCGRHPAPRACPRDGNRRVRRGQHGARVPPGSG